MNRISLVSVSLLFGGFFGSYHVAPALHGQQKLPAPAIPKEITSYRDVVKRVLPAVVSLDIKLKASASVTRGDNDTLQIQQQGESPPVGFGSGVLVSPSGVVLTSFHVVEAAESVQVTLADGRKLTSRSVRGDKKTDVAIILLDGKADGPFPYLEMGDSDGMEIGDRVLAVGAPFGLSGSVTHGIISGKGRSGLKLNTFEDFLQTDAAINPGNSGGPLISLDGKVVGINAAIKSKNGGFQGVGLAVASNLCKTVVPGLVKEGVVRRGYLGAQVRELSANLAAQLKQTGVVVAEVYEKTPAARAGLKQGDVITSFGGKTISDTKALQLLVVNTPIKSAVQVTIIRGGKMQTINVTIEENPDDGSRELEAEQAKLQWPNGTLFSRARDTSLNELYRR